MIIKGTYHRKSDDSHFVYTAKVHMEHGAFSAKVFDSQGTLAGTPLIFINGLADEPEDQCRSWVESCICDRVGVR